MNCQRLTERVGEHAALSNVSSTWYQESENR